MRARDGEFWGGDECDHMIDSTIPPPLPPPPPLPLAGVAFISVRGAERTSAENGRACARAAAASPPNRLRGETAGNRPAINYSLSEIFIRQSSLHSAPLG